MTMTKNKKTGNTQAGNTSLNFCTPALDKPQDQRLVVTKEARGKDQNAAKSVNQIIGKRNRRIGHIELK